MNVVSNLNLIKPNMDNEASKTAEVDLNNYKGIYGAGQNQRYQDKLTGAHFEYQDMCNRLNELLKKESKQKTRPKIKAVKIAKFVVENTKAEPNKIEGDNKKVKENSQILKDKTNNSKHSIGGKIQAEKITIHKKQNTVGIYPQKKAINETNEENKVKSRNKIKPIYKTRIS